MLKDYSLSYMHRSYLSFFLLIFCIYFSLEAVTQPKVLVGSDILMTEEYSCLIKGKKIGLITNHTAVNNKMLSTIDLLKTNAKKMGFTLSALFAPEHGISGSGGAGENIQDQVDVDGINIYSLHGKTHRPTDDMLKGIDTLIYDIQDIGSRSYTYITTLFYVMEGAAKKGIPVIVLDRPNPINGLIVDGPMLEEKWRSSVGYINVPYCHGMTIGELAQFFNGEYKIGCKLDVIPMKGWLRHFSFQDTKLPWIPTSPYIPESTTPFFYPTTGILGQLSVVNIGIGYTLPFKLVGAPWIESKNFAKHLNAQKFPGVHFEPFHYKPFYGKFSHEDCQGVLIVITDPKIYKPVSTQFLIMGILKSLYPTKFKEALTLDQTRKDMFCKITGTEEVLRLLVETNNIVWKLKALHQNERDEFIKIRKKYLISDYSLQ